MRRGFARAAVLLLSLGLATAAWASMGTLTVNQVSFDSRTFQYGGHISYSVSPYMGESRLTVLTHNNSNCNSGQCGSDPHFMVKCTKTAGSTSLYSHNLDAKILVNGVAQDLGTESVSCYHSDGTPSYNVGDFVETTCNGGPFKYRVTILDNTATAQDSNDVTLN